MRLPTQPKKPKQEADEKRANGRERDEQDTDAERA